MASLSVFDDKAGADESVKLAHNWVQENAAASSRTRRRSPKAWWSRAKRR